MPWPEKDGVVKLLFDALVEEAGGHAPPGATAIARGLSKGVTVFTTDSARKIWRGGLGNFIREVDPPEDSVEVVCLRMSPEVWRSAFFRERLGFARRKAEEKRAALVETIACLDEALSTGSPGD